jgi:hypothetical protein
MPALVFKRTTVGYAHLCASFVVWLQHFWGQFKHPMTLNGRRPKVDGATYQCLQLAADRQRIYNGRFVTAVNQRDQIQNSRMYGLHMVDGQHRK